MEKILLKIDISKIDHSKVTRSEYTNRNGERIVEENYDIEVIELNEPKLIKSADTYDFLKTHFVVESQTKEERNAKEKSKFVGSGFKFVQKSASEAQNEEYIDVTF